MSFKTQADLRNSPLFEARWQSCVYEQALIFRNDGRAEFVYIAEQALLGSFMVLDTWKRILSTTPGWDQKGDQAEITDGDILAAVQAQWPTVAEVIQMPPSYAPIP